MKSPKKQKSDMARMNGFALGGWGAVLGVIALAYLLEVREREG